MRERALIRKPDFERDMRERGARIGEQRQRRVQTQAMHIAMRRLAERLAEQLVKAPHAEAAMRGEIRNAQRLAKMRAQPPVDAREVEAAQFGIERCARAGHQGAAQMRGRLPAETRGQGSIVGRKAPRDARDELRDR